MGIRVAGEAHKGKLVAGIGQQSPSGTIEEKISSKTSEPSLAHRPTI